MKSMRMVSSLLEFGVTFVGWALFSCDNKGGGKDWPNFFFQSKHIKVTFPNSSGGGGGVQPYS